jgi:transglutaminase-like putative cysteine protease
VRRARYRLVHETAYTYASPVALSRHRVHLAPRALPWQECREHVLQVIPQPEFFAVGEDPFGNPVTSLCIEADHATLNVRAESKVEVSSRPLPDDAATPCWEDVRARLVYRAKHPPSPEDLLATRFLFESSRVRNKRELAAWAASCFPEGAPLLGGVRALMHRIHDEFTFDPTATDASTPVMEAFERRRGVCQDFAHVMLSCLRSMGLAARYVSGYILTRPPPGRPRLVGADASHAWVSVYALEQGWIDVDPTNASFPDLEHVTLGWGRDYEDVIPVRGVLLGGGAQESEVRVTLTPE